MIRLSVSATAEMDDIVEAVVEDVSDAAGFLIGFCDAWTEHGWCSLEREFKTLALSPKDRTDMKRLGDLLIAVSGE